MATIQADGEVLEQSIDDIAPSEPKRRGRRAYPRDDNGNIVRPDGSIGKAPGRSRTKGSLREQLDGFVTLANMFVVAFKPLYALDDTERVALVKALDQQCQTTPAFRKFMEKFLQGAGGINLAGVALIIVGRRIARANLVPLPVDAPVTNDDLDKMAGSVLYALTAGKSIQGLNV